MTTAVATKQRGLGPMGTLLNIALNVSQSGRLSVRNGFATSEQGTCNVTDQLNAMLATAPLVSVRGRIDTCQP